MSELWPQGRSEGYGACDDEVSPPGEVLFRDEKYPKIPGPAGPDPGDPSIRMAHMVRRGKKTGYNPIPRPLPLLGDEIGYQSPSF